MNEVFFIIRTIHEISGSLLLGEVVVINFILLPAISEYTGDVRKGLLVTIFPKLFNLASVLAATVVITGLFMVFYLTNGNLSALTSGKWGLSILVGGSLGILLTVFHFFLEKRLAKKIGLVEKGNDEKLAEVHLRLKIVPRIGLLVILTIFLLMINAAHGIL